MKRAAALAGFGLALMAGMAANPGLTWAAPVLQGELYPGQAAVIRAETKAKAAAGPCEKELKGGKSGAACAAWHEAVLLGLEAEHKRFLWCMPRMSESTNIPVPDACLAVPIDMRLEVSDQERKVSPKTWKAFDDKMAKYSN